MLSSFRALKSRRSASEAAKSINHPILTKAVSLAQTSFISWEEALTLAAIALAKEAKESEATLSHIYNTHNRRKTSPRQPANSPTNSPEGMPHV